ncbi:hypothetical protein B0T11DRAFT_331309 [Plectosphaerella cucumerina]|uniref:NAD-dependent epimerase/dehydratase domain-containing protein n=1 Tax=Plectosphaerella cucumerina TaxID=40658 RepID=A0A8K0T7B2_9PEZI|nr:hypothetical protein B0T11DRAFT_331309 [Plectosphaerella cucumerina]
MQILVVGGAGMIGGHAALFLQSKGHTVTVGGRHRLDSVPLLAALPFLEVDYVAGTITKEQLAAFDAIVFTAGADMRHVPKGEDPAAFLIRANGEAVPAFAKLARSAGVKNFVHVGSAYPYIVPDLVEASAYLRSRKLAADGVAATSTTDFSACSIDPPFVVGTVPGMIVPVFQAYIQYAEGKFGLPESAPVGALNFISVRSLSEAIAGALENGPAVSGRTILVGDENWSYATYLEKFFKAVRKTDVKLEVREEEHPMMPRWSLYAQDRVVSYEPDPEDVKRLGNYRRHDVDNAIEEIIAAYHQE